jgi:hypothetical protein
MPVIVSPAIKADPAGDVTTVIAAIPMVTPAIVSSLRIPSSRPPIIVVPSHESGTLVVRCCPSHGSLLAAGELQPFSTAVPARLILYSPLIAVKPALIA